MSNWIKSEKEIKKYLKEIKKLAQVLPPMEGHNHALNMQTLFFQHGPPGVQAYMGTMDAIIAKAEKQLNAQRMQVIAIKEFTWNDSTFLAGDRIDMPSLTAKAAIGAGYAVAASETEGLTPEVIADQMNNTAKQG